MRLSAFFLVALLGTATVSLGIFSWSAQAAVFTESSLRFSRLETNVTNVQILVVAKPVSVATEAQVSLTLGTGFSVNSTPGNIGASTDDLPATYQGEALTAWPGIGSNATAVSGQTATFASDDLDAGTLYGFYIDSGINTPTSVGTGEVSHVLATRTAGSVVIDQSQITTAVEQNDEVTITGVIPGTTITADRDFSVQVTTATEENVPPDTVRTYTVTYENNAASDFDIRLEAEWTRGQSEDSEHHSFDVVSYVPGSATKAYGNVTPVVDLDRRIISWTIPAFSQAAGTQTVEFQLRTADNTLSTLPLHYEIKARIISGDATKEATPLGQIYTPEALSASPTPVPSVSPSPAPTKAPTATPVPTATPIPGTAPDLQITKVEVVDISDTSFSMRVITNRDATVTAEWGDSPQLGQSPISSTDTGREHILTFPDLKPGTTYYVQLSAQDNSGNRITLPELFQVTTATRGLPSVINEQGVSALGYGIAIFQGVIQNGPGILLPTGTPLAVTVPFTESTNADVSIRIHSDQVLGLRVPAALPFQEFSPLSQATDKLYSGYVMTPHQTGTYTVTVRVRTPDGVLYQLAIATLRMTDPLTIRDSSDNPIESARLTIEQWHERDRIYVPAEHLNFGVSLPYFTDADGQVPAVLGLGSYRLRVRAAGYEDVTSDILFNPHTDTAYPMIEMTAKNSLIGRLEYSSSIIGDTAHFGRWSLGQLAHSHRFIQLLTAIAVSAAVILSILLVRFYATKETGQRRLTHLRNALIRSVGHTALIILWALTLFVALQSTSSGLRITILFTATVALALWIWLTAIARIKPIHEYWQ